MENLTIALIGNPNSGKTTLFNSLTGSNQRVGNYPGVTVEKKEGYFCYNKIRYHVVDLPGTYSLGAFSEDEVVARDFILSGNPNVIIDVVDANNVERNLYLTSQLLEMGKKVIIALNMVDEAERKDIKFDIDKLSQNLGIPVIPTVASKAIGINEIIEKTTELMEKDISPKNPIKYNQDVMNHINYVETTLKGRKLPYPIDWMAIKIAEGDKEILTRLEKSNVDEETIKTIKNFYKEHEEADLELEIINARYAFANYATKDSVKRPKEEKITTTDKIDKIITNKYLGIPIFAIIMFIVFQLTFKVGQELLGGLSVYIIETFGKIIESLLTYIAAPNWLIAFVSDGVISGVGAVIEFVPVITVLYLLLGLLEDSGYMARAAYIWDDFMRGIGLQGKAFVSLIIGFGCNVPGIMSARTLDNKKDRMITTLITPFMSCGAKLPIYSVFIGAFFSHHGGLVLFSIYALGITVALLMAKVFSKTLFKGEVSSFIMELPPYRMPTAGNVLRNMWDNVKEFVTKAGTIVFAVVTLVWVLAVLPTSAEPYSQYSILGRIGTLIAPVFKPAGFGNWQASVALFAGVPAKEAVVGTLGMLYAGEYMEEGTALVDAVRIHFTSLSALSFMVMTLLYTPCAAVLGIVKKETNSYKWPLFLAFYTLLIAWVAAVAVFQIGSLSGFN